MLVVGLTGGIGSGKSTVANLFAKHGVPIIDADVIAREITTPNHPAFVSIIQHFGKDVVLQNGSLNRAKLRQLIFSQPEQKLWLEKLLHPLIRDEIANQITTLTTPYCIAVIPLLLEAEVYSFIDRILVVDTTTTEQLKRTLLRDNVTEAEAQAILQSQTNREARLAKAHDIITNNGTLDDLIPQVNKLHEMYLKLSM